MFNSLENRMVSLVKSAQSRVPVVRGVRTDDLPAPCVSVYVENAENFNTAFTDVFRVSIQIKYEEHYADVSEDVMDLTFSSIINVFLVDKLGDLLNVGTSKIFSASVVNINKSTEGDYLVNEIAIDCVAERDH